MVLRSSPEVLPRLYAHYTQRTLEAAAAGESVQTRPAAMSSDMGVVVAYSISPLHRRDFGAPAAPLSSCCYSGGSTKPAGTARVEIVISNVI